MRLKTPIHKIFFKKTAIFINGKYNNENQQIQNNND